MDTCISDTKDFSRVKECVRITVIRRLDRRRICNAELATIHREVRAAAKSFLADQYEHDIPRAEQQRLLDEVADEICTAGTRGLSESLWEQPTDLLYWVAAGALMTLLAIILIVWFCPLDFTFAVLRGITGANN